MNTYQSMNPEAFSEEYAEEQRVLAELAQEEQRFVMERVAGLLDAAIDALDAEDFVPEDDCPLDGDAESALASAGFGTDEDYGGYSHDWDE